MSVNCADGPIIPLTWMCNGFSTGVPSDLSDLSDLSNLSSLAGLWGLSGLSSLTGLTGFTGLTGRTGFPTIGRTGLPPSGRNGLPPIGRAGFSPTGRPCWANCLQNQVINLFFSGPTSGPFYDIKTQLSVCWKLRGLLITG